MNELLNEEICKNCGGNCCQRCGCSFHPEQFKDLSVDEIKKILSTGIVSVDWWEGDPRENVSEKEHLDRTFYLRIRNSGYGIVDPSWCNDPCVLWDSETGCPIDFDHRPAEGSHLIPHKTHRCDVDNPIYNKQGIAIAWAPFYDAIGKAMISSEIEISDNLDIMEAVNALRALMK